MPQRCDIKVGYTCNNNCRFCYVANSRRKFSNRTTDEIKKNIDEAKENGVKLICFTGGEPTIRSDILDLITYAKVKGFDTIQIQTNGRRFHYKSFCENVVKAGANEYLFSIHGNTPELHDFLTRSPGSWKQCIKGVKNLKKFSNQTVLINTTIVKQNYNILPELTELFIELKVDGIQFTFINPEGNAWKNKELIVKMSKTIPYIFKCIKKANENNVWFVTEGIPFCLMKGYEKHVGELYIPNMEIRAPDYFTSDFDSHRRIGKVKEEKCNLCKKEKKCEGVWKNYVKIFGFSEFKPIKK